MRRFTPRAASPAIGNYCAELLSRTTAGEAGKIPIYPKT
jgi:hypothetical protein